MKRFALCIAILLVPAAAGARPRWPDRYESRVEVLGIVQTINAQLLASNSATKTLEEWCASHHMAAEPKIVARRLRDVVKRPSAEQLRRLGVDDPSQVRYRRVELRCGTHLFSAADNWYVPARLTAAMNEALQTSDAPFGKVVAPLHPYRRTIAATMLWMPLLRGWEGRRRESRPAKPLAIPPELFEHRAVLYTSDDVPFSEVVERYQSELLDFSRD